VRFPDLPTSVTTPIIRSSRRHRKSAAVVRARWNDTGCRRRLAPDEDLVAPLPLPPARAAERAAHPAGVLAAHEGFVRATAAAVIARLRLGVELSLRPLRANVDATLAANRARMATFAAERRRPPSPAAPVDVTPEELAAEWDDG